jgi:WD40 repeat protein
MLHVWDLETGSLITPINAGPGLFRTVRTRWFFNTQCSLSYFACPVNSWTVAFSPDTRHLATGNNRGEVSLFEIATREKKATLETRGDFVLSVAFVGRSHSFLTYLSGAAHRSSFISTEPQWQAGVLWCH